MATHSNILAWRSPWTEDPGGLQSMGHRESDMTDRLSFHLTSFHEDLQDLLELTPPKDVLFIIGDWNAKVGSQEIPGVTDKFGHGVQNEARQRIKEFFQENTPLIANTLFSQHKKRLYTWTSPDSQH